MKTSVTLVLSVFMLVACDNFKEGVKETGDTVGVGVENAIEGARQLPRAIGDAANKIEADLRKNNDESQK